MKTQTKNPTKKQTTDKFIESLLPDSDKRMWRIAGTSIIAALSVGFWATTYERVIDEIVFEKTETVEISTTMNIIEKKEEKKQEKQEKKIDKKEIKRKRQGGGGKRAGSGKPRSPEQRGILKIIAARTQNANAEVYNLTNQKFARDIDKILKNVNGLQVTGKTQIAGSRKGKLDAGFNEGVASGGSGGIGDAMASIIGGPSGAISTKTIGKLKPPSERDIDMGPGTSSRSASDIMKVVRQRTPGLRHIYNRYLKKKPGFQGKVTLKFTIAPGGEIVSIAVVSSTTGYAEFDADIKNAVGRWTFSKVKSGNTTVTIPFTFSE
jgi:TonB family protein